MKIMRIKDPSSDRVIMLNAAHIFRVDWVPRGKAAWGGTLEITSSDYENVILMDTELTAADFARIWESYLNDTGDGVLIHG